MHLDARKQRTRGFTTLELLMAASMMLVVTTLAVPAVLGTIKDAQLRSTAISLSGLLQRARMKAAATNTDYPVRVTTLNGATVVYIDSNNNSQLDASEQSSLLSLPRNIVFDTAGPAMSLGFGTAVLSLPGFDSRGLPCNPSGGSCTFAQGTGFYYYLRQDRIFTTSTWAAVSVSPAGRIKVWSYTGTAWQ
ncbi:MAG: pilus assembly FimT family protein [Terriglobales bacterium]